MTIEQAIRGELLGDSDVIAEVGDSVYYHKAPQDTTGTTVNPRSYIVITKVAAPRLYAFDGVSPLVEATFQLDMYSETYGTMISMADDVRGALANFGVGTLGSITAVQGVFLENEADFLEREIEPPRHHRTHTYRIFYIE